VERKLGAKPNGANAGLRQPNGRSTPSAEERKKGLRKLSRKPFAAMFRFDSDLWTLEYDCDLIITDLFVSLLYDYEVVRQQRGVKENCFGAAASTTNRRTRSCGPENP